MPKSTVTLQAEWRYPVESSFVRNASLSVDARLLYIIIKSYVGPNCALPFPSLDTLARHMDRHRKSVQKNLKELEMAGFICRIKQKISGRFASTRYDLFESATFAKTHRRHKNCLRSPQALLTPTVKVPTKRVTVQRGMARSSPIPKSAPLPDVAASAPPPKIHPTDPPKAKGIAGVDIQSEHEQPAHMERNECDGVLKTSEPNDQYGLPLPGFDS